MSGEFCTFGYYLQSLGYSEDVCIESEMRLDAGEPLSEDIEGHYFIWYATVVKPNALF